MFCLLLVDDHTGYRRTVSGLLRSRFPEIQVEEAGDAVEALDKVARYSIDLVLMDIRLPGENGIELTRVIKSAHLATSVVILSGYDLPQYRQAAFRGGADCFLYKGEDSCLNDVLARVAGAIDTKR